MLLPCWALSSLPDTLSNLHLGIFVLKWAIGRRMWQSHSRIMQEEDSGMVIPVSGYCSLPHPHQAGGLQCGVASPLPCWGSFCSLRGQCCEDLCVQQDIVPLPSSFRNKTVTIVVRASEPLALSRAQLVFQLLFFLLQPFTRDQRGQGDATICITEGCLHP